MIIPGILLACSISSVVLSRGLFNYMGKGACKTNGDTYYFNGISYIICILIFVGLLIWKPEFSLFSALLGLAYGVAIALANNYSLSAYRYGSMHLTTLIITSSMIIPALSGAIFFKEPFSLPKLIAIFALLFFVYFTLNRVGNDRASFSKKWLLHCLIAAIFTGAIGIIQKIHQSSVYKEQSILFLLMAFLCSLVYSFFSAKKYGCTMKMTPKILLFSVLCGICCFIMHYINLIMSGVLPSQLFFPLVNGGPMILSTVVSVVVFKETITFRQLMGLIGGTISLIAICLL